MKFTEYLSFFFILMDIDITAVYHENAWNSLTSIGC